jgi:bifunctional non-homologous end joining protein LigD
MWWHEIKHDGYRLMVRRTPAGVRIRTRRGYDWTDRFPLIVEAACRLRATSFVLDGEGMILRPDGVSDFDALHDRRRDREVQLLAFDLVELDGEDLRADAPERRKAGLAKLLLGSEAGIQLTEHLEAPGRVVFAHACALGLEGVVSKRRDAPYRHGRCRSWLKVKNPESPAALRVWEGSVLRDACPMRPGIGHLRAAGSNSAKCHQRTLPATLIWCATVPRSRACRAARPASAGCRRR